MANLTPGQVYQKRGDFIWKNALIEHNSISLQAVCTKPTRVGHCCETPFCAKIGLAGHCLYFKCLTYFSLVAGLLHFGDVLTFIENFIFIHNSIASLRPSDIFSGVILG